MKYVELRLCMIAQGYGFAFLNSAIEGFGFDRGLKLTKLLTRELV